MKVRLFSLCSNGSGRTTGLFAAHLPLERPSVLVPRWTLYVAALKSSVLSVGFNSVREVAGWNEGVR